MENERIFRNLVTNKQYKKPLGYHQMLFAFQTLFYFTSYSYQCCPCAFQHEFFDYIEDDGTLNEEVLEKIAQSIGSGKCPHVTDVSEKLVKETAVSGLHVAIATCTDTSESTIEGPYVQCKGCFKIENYALALIKYKYSNAEYFYEKYLETIPDPHQGFVLYCTKQDNNAEAFTINKLCDLEPFIHTRKGQLLEKILKIRSRIWFNMSQRRSYKLRCRAANAMEYAIENGITNLLDMLLEEYNDPSWNFLGKFTLLAILYDNPEAFENLLKYTETNHQAQLECNLVLQMFDRPNCKAILSKFGLSEGNFENDSANMRNLLLKFTVYDGIRPECFTAIQKLSDKEHYDHGYRCPCFPDMSYQWHFHPQDVREMLKLHIHANSDLELQDYEDVSFELRNDYNWEYTFNTEEGNFFQKPRSQFLYECGGKEHGLLEQDHVNFALNFRPHSCWSVVSK